MINLRTEWPLLASSWRLPVFMLSGFLALQGGLLFVWHQQQLRAEAARDELNWVHQQQNVSTWLKNRPDEKALGTPVGQAVRLSAQQRAVALPTFDDTGNTVKLRLDSIDFSTLFSWLNQLQQEWGVVVMTLEMQPVTGRPGYVRVVRLTLGRNQRWN